MLSVGCPPTTTCEHTIREVAVWPLVVAVRRLSLALCPCSLQRHIRHEVDERRLQATASYRWLPSR
jgi:hypothetical protein